MRYVAFAAVCACFLGCMGGTKQMVDENGSIIPQAHFVTDNSGTFFTKSDGTPSEKP